MPCRFRLQGSPDLSVTLRLVILTLSLWLIGPDLARADEIVAAQAAFTRGDYEMAAELAEATGGANGLALAARALLAKGQAAGDYVILRENARRAGALARRAMRADGDHLEAAIALAAAYGAEGRGSGNWSGSWKRLPQKTLAAIRTALDIAPQDAFVHALMGAWHMEVSRRGSRAGQRLYGASEADGVAWFKSALARAPDDVLIIAEYAMALSVSCDAALREQSDGAMADALSLTPRHALDISVQMQLRTAEVQQPDGENCD